MTQTKLTWTAEPPIAPEWYRVRRGQSGHESVVEVYWGNNGKKAAGPYPARKSTLRVLPSRLDLHCFELKGKRFFDAQGKRLNTPSYEWYGPIEPPAP